MRSMDFYPRAAMERAMKVQDVMLQAMAKKSKRPEWTTLTSGMEHFSIQMGKLDQVR